VAILLISGMATGDRFFRNISGRRSSANNPSGNTASAGGNGQTGHTGPTGQGTAPLTLRERLAALRNLPRFFRLVWETSPRIMIANSILRIFRSAIPVAILYVGKLIIDQVILLAGTQGAHPAIHGLPVAAIP